MEPYISGFLATLLLSLRIAPALSFAPPFTYLRAPAIVKLLLSIGLAAWIAIPNQNAASGFTLDISTFVTAAATELLLGVALALALQIAFAALLTAGRVIDFQAGFGLAVLADPALRTQMPLIGTLFAYAAAAVFFTTSGPTDMLALWRASIERVPIGGAPVMADLQALTVYISSAFALAFGIAGAVMLVLFLVDLTIAFLSRTLPQMNVLLLGFQVKTLTLLVTLPFVFAFSGALFLRLVRLATSSTLDFL
ncbi:MAG TPA: flagellar biosynthetic protein FliR [Hyphomonadaceae bacterium]|jgi:flagellar biosynthetic protein FliR|nr:flagellar biosynthetic protein FliR [Hyphomonadaceae bacterium]